MKLQGGQTQMLLKIYLPLSSGLSQRLRYAEQRESILFVARNERRLRLWMGILKSTCPVVLAYDYRRKLIVELYSVREVQRICWVKGICSSNVLKEILSKGFMDRM